MTDFELPRTRQVGHLTVLRPPRTVNPSEFSLLPLADQLIVLRSASGREKRDLLLAAADPELLVRQLPAQEIYLLIKELGMVDAVELVPLVDSGQLTTIIDLDSWRLDQLDGSVALAWLTLLAEGGEEKVLSILQELDFELLVLMFQKLVTIVRAPEDWIDDDARLEAQQRDGGYELEYRDPESGKVVAALLDLLFRHDLDLFRRLLTAVRWESAAILEEENFALRNLRLQELGFPDPAEARGIHAPLDPQNFDPAAWRRHGLVDAAAASPPGFMLTAAAPRHLLAEVLAAGIDPETAWELTFLLNRVMSADRVDVGSYERVQEATDEVFRTLNLALEHLCGTDAGTAGELLASTYLQALFRLGRGLILPLQRRARGVLKSPVGPYLDPPSRELVEAIGRDTPRFPIGLEDAARGGERPFASLAELRLAGLALTRLELEQRLFVEKLPFALPAPADLNLTGCIPAAAAEITLPDLFLTALANRILGRDFAPEPVPASELAALHAKVCQEGSVAADLRQETLRWLDSLEPGGGAFGDYCLDLWEEELCPLEPATIDPRYVSGLIVRVEGDV